MCFGMVPAAGCSEQPHAHHSSRLLLPLHEQHSRGSRVWTVRCSSAVLHLVHWISVQCSARSRAARSRAALQLRMMPIPFVCVCVLLRLLQTSRTSWHAP